VARLKSGQHLYHPIYTGRLLFDQQASLPKVGISGLAHEAVGYHDVAEDLSEFKLLGRVGADLGTVHFAGVQAPRPSVLNVDEELFGNDGVGEGRLDVLVPDVVGVKTLLVGDEAVCLLDGDLFDHQIYY
jgi:hypothetical protein